LSCLVFTTKVTIAANFSELGSIDNPILIECNYCYDNIDFTNLAKQNTGVNSIHYYLIFNTNSEILKTVYSFNNWEPEVGINMNRSFIVTTLDENILNFTKYIDWIADGRPELTESFDYPETGHYSSCCFYNDAGSIADYARWSRDQLRQNDAFYVMKTHLVEIKFSNGDIAFLLVLPGGEIATVVLVLSENDTVLMQTNNGTGQGDTGDSVNSNTVWMVSASSTITWYCSFSGNTLTCIKKKPE